jgi:hypothetical protein
LTTSIPCTAVIRVSRGNFDPASFTEAERMTGRTGAYLIPAISRLDGLLGYHAGASPDGSMVHLNIWQSEQRAQQMGKLKAMIVDARSDAEAPLVEFIPIINYPVSWHI